MNYLNRKRSDFLYFNWKRLSKDKTIFHLSSHISAVWQDIEYLRVAFAVLFKEMCNQSNQEEQIRLFECCSGLSKNFYIHMDIIRKLIEKVNNSTVNIEARKIILSKKVFLNKIRDVRNSIIIHRDKEFFYKISIGGGGTVKEEVELYFEYIKKVGKDNKKTERINLLPLSDTEELESTLLQLNKLFAE